MSAIDVAPRPDVKIEGLRLASTRSSSLVRAQ
jgi:hypothetical protein